MNKTTTPKKRTITLTGRSPVIIVEADWPMLAQGREEIDSRNGTPLPNYERALWRLCVRQHADGRAIVYGVADPPSAGWPTHGCSAWRGGRLILSTEVQPTPDDPSGLAHWILRVGGDLERLGGAPETVIRDCLASLPAEEL